MNLIIGVIANVHGIRGELRVYPETNDLGIFETLSSVFIDDKEYKRSSTRFHKNMVLLKLEGIEDRTTAERLKGKEIRAKEEELPPLHPEEYYIYELIGSTVYDEKSQKVGELVDVLENKANDVFVVRTDEGKEILLPYIDECVLQVDQKNKKIVIKRMEGLL